MKRIFLAATCLLSSVAYAQTPSQEGLPAGASVWKNGVPPNGLKQKDVYENHIVYISQRVKDGQAEIHENKTDIFVIQSGTATIVLGGKVPDAKQTGSGELLGTSIEGGVKSELGPGDVVHIPAGMPHQIFIPVGGKLTYLIVKVSK